MKVSDYIAGRVEAAGVTHVFELVGGMITFLVDSFREKTAVQLVSMHHEQGAGFAAEGYARRTGMCGVALATSGPGATNLLTAIASCYFDSVPVVFITGQVNRHELRGDRPIRQLGFQETDIVAMARGITKAAWQIHEPAAVVEKLHRAFALARSGRPGPVLLDIPMDVQRSEIVGESPEIGEATEIGGPQEEEVSFCRELQTSLEKAKRPLVLAGGGISAAGGMSDFRRLADAWEIPVVNSLMAVDVLPYLHPLRVGLIGSYGNRWANVALSESDLLVVLGSRLDIRQTGADVAAFKGERQIYHIDCEPGELNNRVRGCRALICELRRFLSLGRCVRTTNHWNAWSAKIADNRKRWPDTGEQSVAGIHPNHFMHRASEMSAQADAFVVDVGQHQMWAAQSLELRESQRFITSGGMGAMGFALPAGIGACLAMAGRSVVVIAGDGGFQLNIQELQTVVRNALPLKIIVLNNGCHGMVRQFQESYFRGRYQSTLWGYSAPNFAEIGQAYGIPSLRIETPDAIDRGLSQMWADPQRPFLLEVIISTAANAYPKMAFGRPMAEMEPLARPVDMEGT